MLKNQLGFPLATAIILAAVSTACAKAVLLSTAPAAGASVRSGYFEFHLRFDSFVDRERSQIYLTHPNGHVEYLVLFGAGNPDELMARAQLAPGAYILHWQARQPDGGAASGTLKFSVSGR